ncbi:Hypothetical protein, putative [Bodo saltans]|uniref:Uncharacterized protein n=1 Tax=Bodo saltans TaxID=75058 RepID=A0A0S4JNI2_BODSA|nr:Hypothetical protein, putative [Bodo saltans]|eukprot:CUG91783.1 Hypothetical protein, putative [Bodo saltans]
MSVTTTSWGSSTADDVFYRASTRDPHAIKWPQQYASGRTPQQLQLQHRVSTSTTTSSASCSCSKCDPSSTCSCSCNQQSFASSSQRRYRAPHGYAADDSPCSCDGSASCEECRNRSDYYCADGQLSSHSCCCDCSAANDDHNDKRTADCECCDDNCEYDVLEVPTLLTIPLRPPRPHHVGYRMDQIIGTVNESVGINTEGGDDDVASTKQRSSSVVFAIARPPPPLSYLTSSSSSPYFGTHAADSVHLSHQVNKHPVQTNEVGCQVHSSLLHSNSTTIDHPLDSIGANNTPSMNNRNVNIATRCVDVAVNTHEREFCEVSVGSGGDIALLRVVDSAVNTDALPSEQHQLIDKNSAVELSRQQSATTVTSGLLSFDQQQPQYGQDVGARAASGASLLTPTVQTAELPSAVSIFAGLQLVAAEASRREFVAEMQQEVVDCIRATFHEVLVAPHQRVQQAIDAVQRAADESVNQQQLQYHQWMLALQQTTQLNALEADIRSEQERNALDILAAICLSWHHDRVNAEITSAHRTVKFIDIELLQARNESLRLENTVLTLQRQLQMIRTMKVGIAAQQYCQPLLAASPADCINNGDEERGAEQKKEQQQRVTENVGREGCTSGGHSSSTMTSTRVTLTSAAPAGGAQQQQRRTPSLLDSVDLNMPIHERFARAHRVAANICHETTK